MDVLRPFRRWAGAFAAGAFLSYAGAAGWLFLKQGEHVYHPVRAWSPVPADLRYEPVRFEAEDGVALSAWWVEAPDPRGTVLYFHGNAGNVSSEAGVLRMFRELGLSALAVDYRGYGQSEGEPDEQGTYRDARAAWDFVTREKGVPPGRVVVWGRSLGAAVAANLASRTAPRAVVLEAAFTSLPDIASELYPLFPTRWLARFRYDNLQALKDVHAELLIVHSTEDRLVGIAHGRRLYDAANAPKEFLEIRGPHKGLPYQEVYRRGIEKFLDRVLGPVR